MHLALVTLVTSGSAFPFPHKPSTLLIQSNVCNDALRGKKTKQRKTKKKKTLEKKNGLEKKKTDFHRTEVVVQARTVVINAIQEGEL